MKIVALPLFDMANIHQSELVKNQRWAVISIGNDPSDWPKLDIDDKNFKGVLRLAFDDVDVAGMGWNLFTVDHANEIITFFDKISGDLDVLVVHCIAGLCRSPAVAAALNHYENGGDGDFFKYYQPNRLVYRTLMNVLVSKNETSR